jgi:hypothetical protein
LLSQTQISGDLDFIHFLVDTGAMRYICLILAVLVSLGACNTTQTGKKEPFFVDYEAPCISVGTAEIYLDRLIGMGGIKAHEINAYYYPEEDAVCLFYKIDFINYYMFWNREGREAFIRGFTQYKEDLGAKKLSAKGSVRTKRAYGMTDSFIVWMPSKFSIKANGNSFFEIGYFIKNVDKQKIAFFTINQREVYYEDPVTHENNRRSPDILIYLTRGQAEELVAIFDQDFLSSLSPGDAESKHRAFRLFDILDLF